MKDQNIKDINSYISARGTVSYKEICKKYKISMNTARRYMDILVNTSNVEKVYGGVRVKTISEAPIVSSYEERLAVNQSVKECIGKRAASFILPNDIVFMDNGTTVSCILHYLPKDIFLTIVTGSIAVINACIPMPNVRVVVLPGDLYRETMNFADRNALAIISGLNIPKAFMAATGITLENGLTNTLELECEIKHAVVERAKQVFLLADSSKFGFSALRTFCPFKKANVIITESTPSKNFVMAIEQNQQQLVIADSL